MKARHQPTQQFAGFFDGQPATLGKRWRRHLSRAVEALGAGGSMIPFGDNGDVFRALAEARRSEASGGACC